MGSFSPRGFSWWYFYPPLGVEKKYPLGCISDFGVRRGQEKRWLTTRASIFRVEASVDRYFSHRVTGDTVRDGVTLEA